MLQKDVPKEMSYCSCGNGFGNDTAYTFYKDNYQIYPLQYQVYDGI